MLGPNGAGKTSTLEMLEGMNDIDGGLAIIDGLDVSKNSYEVKRIIGVQLQANEYFDRLNLIELLILFGKLYSQEIDPIKLLQGVNLEEKAKPLTTKGRTDNEDFKSKAKGNHQGRSSTPPERRRWSVS